MPIGYYLSARRETNVWQVRLFESGVLIGAGAAAVTSHWLADWLAGER